MLILRLTTALFLLKEGVLAATKTAGESCALTDTCTTPDSYCDAGKTKTCQCNTGFALAGSTCARVHGQVCDASMCVHQDMICKDNKCACDTNANVKAGSANDDTCECADSYTRRPSDSKCVKKLTQACTADSDCVDNAECSSQNKCACKTGYITSGDTRCTACADGFVQESGVCKTKAGQSCTPSADTCVNNSICTGGTGTTNGTCTCNDADNVMTDIFTGKCKCKDNYGLTAAGKCALVDGQLCSAATDKCVDNAVCKTKTDEQVEKCTCDDTKFYAADPNTKLCVCDSAKAWKKDGKCYLGNGQPCSNVAECYPVTGKVCRAETNDGDTVCTCDENKHFATNGWDYSCECVDTYLKEGNVCWNKILQVGDACNTTHDADPCPAGAICDKLTEKCVCDVANNVIFSAGGCDCKDNFVHRSGRCCECAKTCHGDTVLPVYSGLGFYTQDPADEYQGTHEPLAMATIGQSCMGKDTPDVCVSGATCMDNSTTPRKDFMCTCKGTVQDDGTCGAAAVVTSLVGLMAGLLVTSRFV